jgi:hypothetical protein
MACQPKLARAKAGAGEGNRTLTASLEGWNSTVELHPHTPEGYGGRGPRGSSGFRRFSLWKEGGAF